MYNTVPNQRTIAVRSYKPDVCENPHLAEYAAGLTEKYAERDVIPSILALSDSETTEFYYCQYYRMHRELPLHEISVADINSCRAECVMQKLRSQGYSIRCWSALFANAIPVIFACVSSEHGSLIKVTADYSISSALESCILAFFENRQLENLIKRGRKKYIQEPYTDEDFYNFIKTGENIFPCGFFDSINKTAGTKAPPVSIGNDCVSLLKLLKS